MAGPGYDSVRASALAHQACIIHVIAHQSLLGHFRRHALFPAKLYKFVNVFLMLGVCKRINNRYSRQVIAGPVSGNLAVRTDQNDIGNAFFRTFHRCLVGTLVHGLRQYNFLFICSGLFLNAVYKRHFLSPSVFLFLLPQDILIPFRSDQARE